MNPPIVFYSRIDAFGDGLLRLPALRAARTAFPEAKIVYGCAGPSTLEKALRRHVAHLVDEFRTKMPLPDILAEFGRPGTMVADSRNLAPRLIGQRLRLIGKGIDYEANFPGFALAWPRRSVQPRPEHNAWRYHRMVERLAGRALPFDHRLTPPEAARTEAARRRGDDRRPLVLTNANGAGDQRLAAEQTGAVLSGLCDRGNRVMHLITPGEGPSAEHLLAMEPRVEIVAPGPSFEGAALDDLFLALGEVADAYVGSDGGMAHLMATV
ncbi:MAG: glycosyltransferase family 9 protein, partial [Rhizobiaceae bacterium]